MGVSIRGFFNDGAAALTIPGTEAETRLTPNRGLHVNLRSQNGVEFGTNANPIFTKTASLFAVGGLDLDAFNAGVQNFAATGGVFNDGLAAVPSGDEAEARITAFRALHHNLRDSSGNELLTQKVSALSIPVVVASDQSPIKHQGDFANGVTDAGNPVKVGGLAKTAIPVKVADGQRVNGVFDAAGRQITTYADRSTVVRGLPVNLTTTTETTILAAAGAGIFQDITRLVIANSGSAQSSFSIRDTTGGTVQLAFTLDKNTSIDLIFDGYPMQQTTANSNWTAQLGAAGTCVVTAFGVQKF